MSLSYSHIQYVTKSHETDQMVNVTILKKVDAALPK